MADFLPLTDSLVLSRVHDAVLFLDHDHRIVSANERFFTWTSFTIDQVVGRPVAELWEDRVRWTDWLTVLRLAGAARDSEVLDLVTRGGDPIPVEVHLAVVPGVRVRKPGKLLVLHDLRPLRSLEQLVRQDPLTGVSSRSALLPRLEEELVRVGKYQTSLAVILLDIDGFRGLNDRWGPLFGDEVLRVMGAALREGTGAEGLAGRWGSDEFLVVLPLHTADRAFDEAERLRTGFADRLFVPEGIEVVVTASFGVAVSGPSGHDSPQTLLPRAAEALSRARSGGGNRVELSP